MHKVTVALNTFNRSDLLKYAIQAILNQKYTDFEFLILDNGSTDNTEKVVKSFKDERIIYKKNLINSRNFYNYAFFIAKGEYLIITHDDDYMLPNMLEYEVNILETMPNVVCVSTNAQGINKNNEIIINRIDKLDDNIIIGKDKYLNFFLNGFSIICPTVMFRLDFFRINNILFNPIAGLAADQYLWYETLKNDVQILIINEVLYSYRIHSEQDSVLNGISMNIDLLMILLKDTYLEKNKYIEERKIIIQKLFYFISITELSGIKKKELINTFNHYFEFDSLFSFTKLKFYFFCIYPRFYKILQRVLKFL